MKMKAVKGLAALAAVVCLCMFFSGTIKTLTTAKVKLVTAKQGRLEEQVKLHGTLIFPETEDVAINTIPADTTVVIRRMRATVGKQISEGDVLFEAEVSGGADKLASLRSDYDSAQSELMSLERKNSGLRMTRQEENWIAAYDALNSAKAAARDARSALEVRAQMAGVMLADGRIPENTKDEELKAAQEALDEALRQESLAQTRYDSANRLGARESVVEYVTKSRELSEKMSKAESDMTALSVLMETVASVTAPHDGFVVAVNLKAGDNLTAKSAALTISAAKVKGVLRADVSSIERRVEEGTAITIERTNGRSVNAKVTGTGVDENSKNYVDAELSNREITNLGGASVLMRNGIDMLASYRANSSTTLLPVSAVRGTGDSRYIYVVSESQNALGQSVMTVKKQDVKVLAEVGSTASIQEEIGRQRVAYMEDRAISDGSEVMAYAE